MARGVEIACKQGCGQIFMYESWRVRHELHCQGKPATEGRIAARQRALVPVGTSRGTFRDPKSKARRNGNADRTPPAAVEGAIVAAATDKAVEIVIAGLRAKRDAIDRAIAALQAVNL